ncbi:hypothetical protein GRH90_01815 [Enterobacteriales bacterium SAP-6]|uniref:Oxygen-regulated invasion protein OrgB n=1 Tax=Acerihabitans arboris TaxID=2691583 RepID=A0A845SEY6_9GAMM|nr:hypothetical protein [Acerihabitans arboris]
MARQREALDVISEARRQARNMVKQARAEVELLRQQGFRDGYQEGMATAAAAVADYMSQGQRLEAELQCQINDRARRLLSTALDHPDSLLALVDEWLASLPEPTPAEPMILLLPESARKSHVRLKRRIEAAWPGAGGIEYHRENRVVMKYGHQVAEFAPEAVLAEGVRRLGTLAGLPDNCRRLTESGLRRLHEVFLQQHALGHPEPKER